MSVKKGKKKERRIVQSGVAHVQASFNNTIVTITDGQGNAVSWSSAGSLGFKGSRKSTPYAAQVAADAKALTEPKWAVQELAWHPSGSGLFLVATDHPESDQNTDRIFALRLSDNSMTQTLAPRGPFGRIKAAPDGQRFAFIGCREDGPSPHDLMLAHHGDRVAGNLTGASLDRPVFDYAWSSDGGLLLAVGDGFLTKFIGYTASGAPKDSAGSLVPGASVKVKNADTSQEFSAQTNDAGSYTFSNLVSGTMTRGSNSRSSRPSAINSNPSTARKSKLRSSSHPATTATPSCR